MQTSTTKSRLLPDSRSSTVASYSWLMLASRSILFVLIQILIAFILAATGMTSAWAESARWWTFMAFLANFASLYLLVRVFEAEGKRCWDILRFPQETWKTDLLWLLGFSIVGMPIAAVVKDPLAVSIFGNAMTPTTMLFRPLPTWAFLLSFLFPLTIWFAELPTYFGYAMPRIEAQLKNGWIA